MVCVDGLSKSFTDGRTRRQILLGLSLEAKISEMIAIVGPSGCGKSTLLKILAGLVKADSGAVEVNGMRIDMLPEKALYQIRQGPVSLISQDYRLLDDETVLTNVTLPLSYGKPRVGRRKRQELATKALEDAGLYLPGRYPVKKLSGGERQRVAIARALIRHPDVLLADEPTSALDAATGRSVTETLRAVANQGSAVLIATHDMAVAQRCDRILRVHEEGHLVMHSSR